MIPATPVALRLPVLLLLAAAASLSAHTAAAADPAFPPGPWPLPQTASCTGTCTSTVCTFRASTVLLATGPGGATDIAVAALLRYKPLLARGPPNPGNGFTKVTVVVLTADVKLGAATDFSYTLSVAAGSGEVTATAATPFGVAYALETLSQFVDGAGTLQCAALSVTDAPEFVHRGLMIDTGRRFYPMDFVKSIIDGLASELTPRRKALRRAQPCPPCRGGVVRGWGRLPLTAPRPAAVTKMNILHFHLSEECFRVESLQFPTLTAPDSCVQANGNNTAFYTQSQIKELVAFGRLRGVRILPEFGKAATQPASFRRLPLLVPLCVRLLFAADKPAASADMPGHSGGFCKTLAADGIKCCGSQIEDDPAGKSAAIISSLLTEMSSLFIDDVMNLGCDETGSAAPCTMANTKSFEIKMIEHLLSIKKVPSARCPYLVGWTLG
jgi:hexosaminidase